MVAKKKINKKNSIVPSISNNVPLANELISGVRKGIFEQGFDKLGRPYQKKLDDKGI